ncbi:MAG: methyltransferase domain-containing protein [Candidatus Hermodarchaeota archaeon]
MKLNVGCGNDIREGWINLDIIKSEGVDVVHDLNKIPLPFEDNSFDYILCKDVLEHVNYVTLMNELHRTLKKGGILRIRVPHFTSKSNYADPTHINLFSSNTFYYFTKQLQFSYGRKVKLFSKILLQIKLEKFKNILLKFLFNFLERWINKSSRHQYAYERTFLRTFPAECIEVILKK